MNNYVTFEKILNASKSENPEPALFNCFDALGPVNLDSLHGFWRGELLSNHHKLAYWMKQVQWVGKHFTDIERVDPFLIQRGSARLSLAPTPTGLSLAVNLPPSVLPKLAGLIKLLTPLVATKESQARLRMIGYRGVVSSAMIYDNIPMLDYFRSVNADTLLGVMDARQFKPLFFLLHRGDEFQTN